MSQGLLENKVRLVETVDKFAARPPPAPNPFALSLSKGSLASYETSSCTRFRIASSCR